MFMIGEDEFGIDESKTEVRHSKSWLGARLDVNVCGSNAQLSSLNEIGKWDWALYPPELYIRRLKLPRFGKAKYTDAQLGRVECAVYMMEHNPIVKLQISSQKSGLLNISGTVEIVGELMQFKVVLPSHKSSCSSFRP
ncbi:hypothetical protein [Microbulbifer halophilus]|uniref:Uncharacterized protein n=1 Tax=Microbulbifer halophilus TaxID=453963 RepID=A0ABW5EFZ7_9GAMM|nr:hypothetical protein [Microbulbifer halophilus]MCW8128671.1 hypothetical protein [Microbulbifer halophilus]